MVEYAAHNGTAVGSTPATPFLKDLLRILLIPILMLQPVFTSIMQKMNIKSFFFKALILISFFQILFFYFGYENTIFWTQAFTSFCLNKVLSLFGLRMDFSETPPLLQWRLITFQEFLRHLEQTYKCLSEVSSLEDLVVLDENLYFGMV